MRAATLTSSMIRRIVFDDEAQTLLVCFRSGLRYLYAGVPRAVYDGLRRAGSAGRFFNEEVRGRYACRADPAQRRYRPTVD
ncbi:KTSC domain-containing protein [Sphingomonas sp.]|uniref:KTSC domain-containing protein n=1 Tax=Sphingomonas sp. TaxID=28214 RepID=UPI003CC54087